MPWVSTHVAMSTLRSCFSYKKDQGWKSTYSYSCMHSTFYLTSCNTFAVNSNANICSNRWWGDATYCWAVRRMHSCKSPLLNLFSYLLKFLGYHGFDRWIIFIYLQVFLYGIAWSYWVLPMAFAIASILWCICQLLCRHSSNNNIRRSAAVQYCISTLCSLTLP